MDDQKQILKLAAEIANMDLGELVQGCRQRLLILDSQIEAFRELEQTYRERLSEMDETIDSLKALYQINLQVLNIVNAPEETGEEKWQRSEGQPSSQRSLHGKFAKNTH